MCMDVLASFVIFGLLMWYATCAWRRRRGETGSGGGASNRYGSPDQAVSRSGRGRRPADHAHRVLVARDQRLHVIGTGVIPACHDTNHSTDQDLPVSVARIDGVDPGLAVATYPDGAVYVNALTSGVIVAAPRLPTWISNVS